MNCYYCKDTFSHHYTTYERIGNINHEYGGHMMPCHLCKPIEHAISYKEYLEEDKEKAKMIEDKVCPSCAN